MRPERLAAPYSPGRNSISAHPCSGTLRVRGGTPMGPENWLTTVDTPPIVPLVVMPSSPLYRTRLPRTSSSFIAASVWVGESRLPYGQR